MTQDPRHENGIGPPGGEITDHLGRCIRRKDTLVPNGQRTESEQQERDQQIIGTAIGRNLATHGASLIFGNSADQGFHKGSEDLRRKSQE